MKLLSGLLLPCLCIAFGPLVAEPPSPFQPVSCEGAYPMHLQGVCSNDRDALYWSWTNNLVKTDLQGHILHQAKVPSHHGDLCHHAGQIYVAVNLGKFNQPAGKADSWVYVYDAVTLAETARHPVPELVHGAGGMAYHDGKFIIIGGLPPGATENYLYEYDTALKFQKRHVLDSGYTLMGIQTVTFAEGAWWFGCYGKPQVLLRADPTFKFTGRWECEAALGIVGLGDGRLLVGRNTRSKDGLHGRLVLARPSEEKGFEFE